jgi:hypothetical protein
MRRVCAPGGRVVVIDSSPAADKADAFNRMERFRDPSHVRAFPIEEHLGLYRTAGLPEPRVTWYRLEGDMEGLIKRSFPNPGDDEKIRKMFRASLDDGDSLGIRARREGDLINYGFPVAVLVAAR